ncbi:MAG TPA: hypothetical protein VF885_14155 [Arthrobacter sp.]
MTDSLQTIIDRHAAATPGPAVVDVIDDHGPDGKSWLICDVVRTRWGNNALNFDGDEATARFVAASFTDVPVLAARLQKVEKILEDMQYLIDNGDVLIGDYPKAAADLRRALGLGPR